jgi:glutathione S-transferase
MLRAVATPPRSAGDEVMALVYVVMMLAVIEYFAFSMAVGMARGRYKIPAPAVSGNPDFERYYRVQMNTLEQMMVFLPSLWTFATFVSASWAAGLGLVFVIGRLVYFIGYTKAANKRGIGFGISGLPTMILMIGGLVGAVLAAIR